MIYIVKLQFNVNVITNVEPGSSIREKYWKTLFMFRSS